MPSSEKLVRRGLWRWLQGTGLNRFELARAEDDWRLRGRIIALGVGGPTEARYEVLCDSAWRTRRADIRLDRGGEERSLRRP